MVILHNVIRYIYLLTNQIHRDAYHNHLILYIPCKATVEFAACLGGILVLPV